MQFRISVGKLPQDTSSPRLDSNSTFENVRQGGTEPSRRTRWQTNGNNFDELSGNNLPKFSKTSESATRFWCVHMFIRFFRWRKLVFNLNLSRFFAAQNIVCFSVWVQKPRYGKRNSWAKVVRERTLGNSSARFLSRRGWSTREVLSRVKALARKIFPRAHQEQSDGTQRNDKKKTNKKHKDTHRHYNKPSNKHYQQLRTLKKQHAQQKQAVSQHFRNTCKIVATRRDIPQKPCQHFRHTFTRRCDLSKHDRSTFVAFGNTFVTLSRNCRRDSHQVMIIRYYPRH